MKTVIIIGGNKGIGLSITKKYLNNNFNVIVGGRTNINLKKFENLHFFKLDATNENSVKKLFSFTKKKFKKIDVVINNLGISEWMPIERISANFFDKIINTNLKSFFWSCKYATLNLKKNGGVIINMSSIAGKRGSKNNSVYSASKFAINGLTQSLAKELGEFSIRVNAICPVLIKTKGLEKALKSKHSPANGKVNSFLKNFKNEQSALRRLPDADDVADLCFFLSSSSSKSITGQCINVDCGVFPQ